MTEYSSDEITPEAEEMPEDMGQEIQVKKPAEIENEDFDWAAVKSFEDAYEVFGAEGIVPAGEVIGDGYSLLKDKDHLLKQSLIVLDWDTRMDEKTKRNYVTVRVVTKTGERFVFNDGSSGIFDQLKTFEAKTGLMRPLYCPRGLRKSDYMAVNDKGEQTEATTFYLDTSILA